MAKLQLTPFLAFKCAFSCCEVAANLVRSFDFSLYKGRGRCQIPRTAGKCYESKYGQLETRTEEEKGKKEKEAKRLREVL